MGFESFGELVRFSKIDTVDSFHVSRFKKGTSLSAYFLSCISHEEKPSAGINSLLTVLSLMATKQKNKIYTNFFISYGQDERKQSSEGAKNNLRRIEMFDGKISNSNSFPFLEPNSFSSSLHTMNIHNRWAFDSIHVRNALYSTAK